MDDDFVMISPQQKVMESDIENQLDNVTNDTVIDIEEEKHSSP